MAIVKRFGQILSVRLVFGEDGRPLDVLLVSSVQARSSVYKTASR